VLFGKGEKSLYFIAPLVIARDPFIDVAGSPVSPCFLGTSLRISSASRLLPTANPYEDARTQREAPSTCGCVTYKVHPSYALRSSIKIGSTARCIPQL